MDKLSKRGFFDALQRLDDSEDEDEDSLENLLFSSRPSRNPDPSAAPVPDSPGPSSLQRSNTEPQALPAVGCRQTPHIDNSRRSFEVNEPRIGVIRRAQTTGTMPLTKAGGPPVKKRKTDNFKLLPENQQIFKGLSFCK